MDDYGKEYAGPEWEEGTSQDYNGEFPEEDANAGIMQKMPFFVGILLAVLIGYLVYSMVVGNETEVLFTVTSAEGTALANNSIQVLAENQTEPVFRESGKARYVANLKTGNYTAEISSPGHKLYSENIIVTLEEHEFAVQLEKDIKVAMAVGTILPVTIGQTGSAVIDISNQGNSSISSLELEVTDVSDPHVQVTVSPARITIPAQQTAQASLNYTVSSALVLGKENQKKVTGKVKIKGTNIGQVFDITIAPQPKVEITPATVAFNNQSAGGEPVKVTITLANRSAVPISNLEMKLEIITAVKNNPDQVLEWFTFLSSGSNTVSIPALAGNESKTFDLQVRVPIQAKIETITGNVLVTSEELPETVKRSLTLQVNKEVQADLTIRSSADTVRLTFDADRGVYRKDLTQKALVKNTGDIELENVIASVKNSEQCSETWLKFEGETTLRRLPKNSEQSVFLTISAPPNVQGTEASMVCTLQAKAINPVTQQPIEGTASLRILPQ